MAGVESAPIGTHSARPGLAGALARARGPILSVLLVHALAVSTGIVMVHTGNRFALKYRDKIVAGAHRSDPASIAYMRGERVRAAAFDFARNLGLGAIPSTVGGLAVVVPYALAACRGWVGGIVSVSRTRTSRLREPHQAAYYLLTLLLQLIPYSLAAGAGVQLGLEYYRRRGESGATHRRWLGLPADSVRDVLWIYVLVVPLFAVASLWEFLSPWNS